MASRVLAGRLVTGSQVGGGSRVTVSARLQDVETGEVLAQHRDEGPADSLAHLIPRVGLQLFYRSLRGSYHRDASLADTPVEAIMAYLAADEAFWRGFSSGQRGEALDHLARALEIDSTFAIAAFDFWSTAGFVNFHEHPGYSRARRLLWKYRDRLPEEERVYVEVAFSPDRPDRFARQHIAYFDSVVSQNPNNTLLLSGFPLGLACDLYWRGHYAGEPEVAAKATNAMKRAWELLGREGQPGHMHWWPIEIALFTGDSARARELIDLYLAEEDPATPQLDGDHWIIYNWLGDTTQLARMREHLDEMQEGWEYRAFSPVHLGFPLDDLAYWARRARDNAVTTQERQRALDVLGVIALLEGRVADALAIYDSLPPDRSFGWPGMRPRDFVQLAVAEEVGEYGQLADSITTVFDEWLAERGRPESNEDRTYLNRACHAELWHVARGDTSRTRGRIQDLRSAYSGSGLFLDDCLLVLEALLADGTAQADETLERLDEYMMQGPKEGRFHHLANVIIARLHARRGNPERALAASRRVEHRSVFPLMLRPAYLREECLAAHAVGDRAGAIQACNHYLTLRPDAPIAQPLLEEWQQVRDVMTELVGERGGRGRSGGIEGARCNPRHSFKGAKSSTSRQHSRAL